MHFSETYTQLLLSLPPDLREGVIQCGELEKVIGSIVEELSSLGLDPGILRGLIKASGAEVKDGGTVKHMEFASRDPFRDPFRDPIGETEVKIETKGVLDSSAHPKVMYELNTGGEGEGEARKIEARLKIEGLRRESSDGEERDEERGALQTRLQRRQASPLDDIKALRDALGPGLAVPTSQAKQVIIPLVHDTEFYNLLLTTLESASTHLSTLHGECMNTLHDLSRTIGDSTRTSSEAAVFHPYSSLTTPAGTVSIGGKPLKSDLYFWREIFGLYVDAEVFESVNEITRGERSVEDSERRLQLFVERVTKGDSGASHKPKMKQSAEALETFLSLNLSILNIKKLSYVNSEATRKILEEHAERTGLTHSHGSSTSPQLLALISHAGMSSLPHTLVHAISETLLTIMPSINDYECVICTSLAFKPIRLHCGHLFCVRCLVKMQKRGEGDCPMCRAPSVLVANRRNIDWALLNFMQDWFPMEAREKLKENEREVTAELAAQKCIVM